MHRKWSPIVLGGAALGLAWGAGWALADLEGSKHDFSAQTGDLCSACHVPHRDTDPEQAPLWEPDADLSRRFGRGQDVGRGTSLCLTCHDGSVAGSATASMRRLQVVGEEFPTVDNSGHRTTDHPVGVAYPRNVKGYEPVSKVLAGGAVQLPNGRVECSSCHDPHNDAGEAFMLVVSNVRSALCLTCHRK